MSSPATKPNPANSPLALIQQLTFSFAPSRILTTGVQLGVFSHIAAGHHTAAEVAKAAGASERGMVMLLDSLTALELLKKKDGRYELSPVAASFLVRESPNYLGYMMEADDVWEAWTGLTEAVRTGKPHRMVHEQKAAEDFFPNLVRTLHITHREPAQRTAQALGIGAVRKGVRAIDIGCGSGVWGIAVAEADPTARVTAQDFPVVLETTKHYVRQHGVEQRFDFLPGDLKQVDFGEGRYDLALIGNIVHGEGEASSRQLFKKLHRALRPGGQVAIIDMVPADDRTGPPFALFFALNMLVHTNEGSTYTLAEYRSWLADAGFARFDTADIGSHSPLIIGTKT